MELSITKLQTSSNVPNMYWVNLLKLKFATLEHGGIYSF